MLHWKVRVGRRTLDDRFGEDLGNGFGAGARYGCVRIRQVRVGRFAHSLSQRRSRRHGGHDRYGGLIADRYGLHGCFDGGGAGGLRRYGAGYGVGGGGRCGQDTRWRQGARDGARGDRRLNDKRRGDGPEMGRALASVTKR